MAAPLRILGFALGALIAAAPLSAQTLRGRVVDPDGAKPVHGAHVLLLDPAGKHVASAFTDEAGLFLVRAPAAGLFRLRVELIGRQSRTSDAFILEEGIVLERTLELPYEPISLDGVQVESGVRCERMDRAGPATARLWEETRKALAAQVASRGGGYRFGVEHYVRELDERGTVVTDNRRYRTVAAIEPFTSRPAEVLAAEGFLQETPDGRILYAPDADVLLSNAFLDTHCFTVRRSTAEADVVGLDFEPVAGRTQPDVAGTLWLDESTAALRSLEFRYVHLPASLRQGHYGGSAHFELLPDGRWIIREWSIRTPIIAVGSQRFLDRTVTGERLVGAHEEGGEVLRITAPDGSVLNDTPRALLAGVVYDSAAGRALAGAEVRIVGTAWRAVTDSAGGFRLDGLPAGRYTVEFAHPRLADLDYTPEPVEVELRIADSVHVHLGLPKDAVERLTPARLARLDSIVAAGRILGRDWGAIRMRPTSPEEARSEPTGAVVGQVIDQGTGRAIADVHVALLGTDFDVFTDARGRFLFPTVPSGRFALVATMLGYARREATVDVAAGRTVEAVVPMATEAISLDPIEVSVRSPALVRNGFYDRREDGSGGRFLTRADIERRNPGALTDLLATVPGVRVFAAGIGRVTVRFNRQGADGFPVADPRRVLPGCEPDVYLDGIRMRDRIPSSPAENRLDTVDLVPPAAIEGVEVYIGAAAPIQYDHPCGVILIWTRRGG